MAQRQTLPPSSTIHLPLNTMKKKEVSQKRDIHAVMDPPSEPKEQLEEKRDEEGLLYKYDVALYGTGLVQSILASALARAGKSVLHCDGNDHYGDLDAVWTLSMIEEKRQESVSSTDSVETEDETLIPLLPNGGASTLKFHSTSKVTWFGLQVGEKVETPFGTGTVKGIPANYSESLAVALDKWTLADGKAPMAYFRLDDEGGEIPTLATTLEEQFFKRHGIQTLRSIKAKTVLKNERYIALDSTPAFILAAGKAVSGMLASNVAEYLEFKTIQGLYWLDNNRLSRVPCSKNDVFGTKLLAPMDKRRLMKFFQIAMDYATQLSATEEIMSAKKYEKKPHSNEESDNTSLETEVHSLNERHLNAGRSLARPQNKAVSTQALEELQQCMQQQMSFDDFLAQKYKLSPKLRSIVRYALAWEQDSASTSLSQGMANLRQHLQALGRFGSTAFIVPMYGSGELSQAFCRSAAVFGATYLLRRALGGVVVKDNEVEGILLLPDKEYQESTSSERKQIESPIVVVPASAIPISSIIRSEKKRKMKILRRVSILSGRLIPSDDGDRHVVFIPPQSGIGNSHVVHCITLDETIHVAPQGCSIIHLTTTIEIDDNDDVDESILTRASQLILEMSLSKDAETVDELYHISFSHDDTSFDPAPTNSVPKGLYLCHHSGQAMTADMAFEQAQRIFSQICPGLEFLGLSDELDTCIKERAAERGYSDDERLMLESALDMIGGGGEDVKEDRKEDDQTAKMEGRLGNK